MEQTNPNLPAELQPTLENFIRVRAAHQVSLNALVAIPAEKRRGCDLDAYRYHQAMIGILTGFIEEPQNETR